MGTLKFKGKNRLNRISHNFEGSAMPLTTRDSLIEEAKVRVESRGQVLMQTTVQTRSQKYGQDTSAWSAQGELRAAG